MNAPHFLPDPHEMDALASDAGALGYDIVDLAGFLHQVEAQAKAQTDALKALEASAQSVSASNQQVHRAAGDLGTAARTTFDDVQTSADLIRTMNDNTRSVAEWVTGLNARTSTMSDTIDAVKSNNAQIAAISMQVNILAINAKIEAARAGESGRGFAVVAEAINTLSRQTKTAAGQISENIETLISWVSSLSTEAKAVSKDASVVLDRSNESVAAVGRMETSVEQTRDQAERIAKSADAVEQALRDFRPNLAQLTSAITTTTSNVEDAGGRIVSLVDRSESMVQATASLGGKTEDAPFIAHVREVAQNLSDSLEAALTSGRITEAHLFDRTYTPIPGTDPEQFMSPSTALFDEILPDLQEPVLDFSPKVVFCAAVDPNGYLPTHNRKFSHPQGDDPVWNTANCRNRRMFNDRVGLKAGQNRKPFLLQVYRRDMGGGEFKIMKDLSAPITVRGKHWGGLRLAYTF